MSTNPIDLNNVVAKGYQSKGLSPIAVETEGSKEVSEIKASQPRLDTIELGNAKQNDIGAYTIDGKKLSEIKQDFANHNETFKKMVRVMIEKQGHSVNKIMKALSEGKEVNITVTVDSDTQKAAQDAISEDGYWGANKTSERILDFAKTLSGGDKTKIENLRNGFLEGFEKAKEAFGGELPEISQQTYDKVIAGFDAWENE
ncbi:hypothetical protein [Acetobacterium sp.]|uniref:hypothetical protein n=1 Tax=Acetobacterium sp. TaxID=1872094 RepID=UPI002F412CC2